MRAQVFPWTLIGLSACASIVYFAAGDWRRGLYWCAAAVLNLAVTI